MKWWAGSSGKGSMGGSLLGIIKPHERASSSRLVVCNHKKTNHNVKNNSSKSGSNKSNNGNTGSSTLHQFRKHF